MSDKLDRAKRLINLTITQKIILAKCFTRAIKLNFNGQI